MEKTLLTTKDLCEKAKISKGTVESYRKQGMPVAIDVPNGIKRYDWDAVIEWLNTKATSR